MFSVLKQLCTKLLRRFGIGRTCLDVDECALCILQIRTEYFLYTATITLKFQEVLSSVFYLKK